MRPALLAALAWLAFVAVALPLIVPPAAPLMRPPVIHYGVGK